MCTLNKMKMKTNKASKMVMMYGLFAAMGNDAYVDAINEVRPKKPKQIKQVEKIIPKGVNKYFYGKNVIYARDQKNADRKARNKGYFKENENE